MDYERSVICIFNGLLQFDGSSRERLRTMWHFLILNLFQKNDKLWLRFVYGYRRSEDCARMDNEGVRRSVLSVYHFGVMLFWLFS